jgi:hypothetical protein
MFDVTGVAENSAEPITQFQPPPDGCQLTNRRDIAAFVLIEGFCDCLQ